MLSLIFNATTISINLLSNFDVENNFYPFGLSLAVWYYIDTEKCSFHSLKLIYMKQNNIFGKNIHYMIIDLRKKKRR